MLNIYYIYIYIIIIYTYMCGMEFDNKLVILSLITKLKYYINYYHERLKQNKQINLANGKVININDKDKTNSLK